ncbi:MAG: radical SAM protein [Paracoccus sp. (in: a-proteobacteria)]|nr:radical SAM protein [Paracoccus sp. (in: a-proteobacteria)]
MLDIDPVQSGDTVSLLLKLVGEVCNLDCAYCYERRKPYSGNRLIEPDSVARLLAQFPDRPLRVELHGGEPLLYPKDRMKRIVKILQQTPQVESVAMQTNGTRLDSGWIEIFRPIAERFEIGVSLDGPADMNSWRLDHRGKPAMDAILRGLSLLNEQGIRAGLIAVVTRRSLGQEKALLELASQFPNVRLLKLVPCFDFGVQQGVGPRRSVATRAASASGVAMGAAWSVTPVEFLAFLQNAFDLWLSEGFNESFVLEPFLALTRSLLGVSTDTCSYSSVKCGHVVTLYPGDEVGSCDELDRGEAAIGRMDQLRLDDTGYKGCRAAAAASAMMQKCSTCDYLNRCHGGCVATRGRFRTVGREEDYCNYRKGLIDFMADRIAEARG